MKNVTIFACLLVCGPVLFGQTAPSSVEGQVINAASGAPVKRATVSLRRVRSLPTAPGQPAPIAGASTVETDEQGRFVFRNLPPGGYSLTAQRQGFLVPRQAIGPNSMFMIGESQQMSGVVVRLAPHSVISGKVLDAGGEPIAEVQVFALRWAYVDGNQQLLPAPVGPVAATNDLGEYRIAGLAAGNYFVMTGTPRLNAVTYAPEQPPRDEPELAYTNTYYPGAVHAAAATPVKVTLGAEVRGIDIKLAKIKTVTIRGRVTDTTATATRPGTVTLTRAGATELGFNSVGNSWTQPDGTFRISGVPPGSYYLTARRHAEDGHIAAGGGVAIEVGSKSMEGITVQALPAVDVDGFVRAAVPGRCGASYLSLLNEGGFAVAAGTSTSPDSKFTLKNVIPGTYKLRIPGGCYVQSLWFGGREMADMRVKVDGSGPLEIILTASQAMVQGTVADSAGKPLNAAIVTFLPKDEAASDLRVTSTTDRAGSFSAIGMRPGAYRVFAWENVEYSATESPEFVKQFESSSQTIVVEAAGRQSVQLTAIPASAVGGSVPLAAVPRAKAGIEGQVINTATGAPLSAATVTLSMQWRSRPQPGMGRAMDRAGANAGVRNPPPEITAETDAQGRFAIKDIEPNFYFISAERQGFSSIESSDRGYLIGNQIVLGNGQRITGHTIRLSPQSVIAGRVADEYGEAVGNVQAVLYRGTYVGSTRRLMQLGMAQTDDLGKFRLPGVAPGSYYLAVMKRTQNRFARPAAEAPASEPQLGFGIVWYPNATDAAGASPISVGAGAEVPIEIVLRRTKVVRIRGTVINDDGTPMSRPMVGLTPRGLATMTSIGNLFMKPGGAFGITDVPAGSYVLSARAIDNGTNINGATSARMAFLPLEVRDSNVDGVQLRLTAGRQVRGTVAWEGSGTRSAFLTASAAEGVSTSAQIPPTGGTFTFGSVWPLIYTVDAVCPYCYVKSIRYSGREVSETGVDFGTEGELRVVLSASAASLDGLAVDRQRRPAAGATIMLAPADRPNRIFSGKTDGRGVFHFGGLRPGLYRVFAWEGEAPEVSPEALAPFQTQATTVRLEESATQKVEVAAIRR